jgi:4'-phosphopantetheinyl transferase
VDVERIKPINNLEDLAHQFCSAPEAKELLSLPEAPRMAAFYHLWTRKEACVKATGDGLSSRLKEIKITFLPDEPARLLEFNASEYPSASCDLMNLQPAAGYAAALAITAQPWNVYCWQWTG